MLPLAVALIAGLLLGFAAGYYVGDRDSAARETASSTAAPSATAAVPPQGPQQADGREWSEQTVAPPAGSHRGPAAEPPSDAPPVAGEAASASAGVRDRADPPPAATRGRLVVQSTPARAAVTINGRWRGRTPLTLDDLQPGRYAIRVVQAGFDVATEQVTLSSTQPSRTVTFTLQRSRNARAEREAAPASSAEPAATTGVLFVDSRPRGAQVFVDGRLVGTTPLRVPELRIGSHVVRLELSGHRRWSTSASVSATRETRVTGSLDPN